MARRFGVGIFLGTIGCLGWGLAFAGLAQTASAGQSAAPPPAFTLKNSTRIVLTDVTVTDAKGNPVHGLPESAFHIFDDKKPQQLSSFVEHHDKPTYAAQSAPAAANVYSNDYLLHPPKVVNVIMLDTTNISLVQQMYLYYEMKQFVAKLPLGEPFAVYSQSGLYTIEQQTFTSDHALLLAAIHRAIPRLPDPDGQYASDFETLHQLVLHLSQVPGRKNVLWFSGGPNLELMANAEDVPAYVPAFVDLRPVYDELEASRIALYPIDARRLSVHNSTAFIDQQMQMQRTAEATGGRAVVNNNELARAAIKIADDDGSYYTLTYAPSDLKMDNKWHTVKVKVDLPRGYHLSYRHGYYDDGANTSTPASHRGRNLLLANGEKEKVASPDMLSQPIIFDLKVLPMLPAGVSKGLGASSAQATGTQSATQHRKGNTLYKIRYTLPASAFDFSKGESGSPGKRQAKVGVALVAFNQFGRPVVQKMWHATLTVDEAQLAADPDGKMFLREVIQLPLGPDYLYAAVWDMVTRRIGSIELPMNVPKPGARR